MKYILTLLSTGFILFFFTLSTNAAWLENGIPLCKETGIQRKPCIESDGAGGVIAAWRDYRNGEWDIYAQRIDSTGSKLWGRYDVPVCTELGTQFDMHMTTDGSGGAILCWVDRRLGWDVYAQRIDASGNILWKLDGIPICQAIDEQALLSIVPDGAGGAICSWIDKRHGWDHNKSVYAQRIDGDGKPVWAPDGIPVCNQPYHVWIPVTIPSGRDGAIILWNDLRDGNKNIYAQRVDSAGNPLWKLDGIPISSSQADEFGPFAAPDGDSGAILCWWTKNGKGKRILAQKLDASGNLNWTATGLPLCSEKGDQGFAIPVSDGSGGAIIVWHEERHGSFDILAQRISRDGKLQWGTSAKDICTAKGNQKHPTLVRDDSGSIIMAWNDVRKGDEDDYDIYAQRIDPEGNILWAVDGFPVCSAPGDQGFPSITSDGRGGAFMLWEDTRDGNDTDLYILRVTANAVAGKNTK
jgi:hypothetical protein